MKTVTKKRVPGYVTDVAAYTCDRCGAVAGRVEDPDTRRGTTHETTIFSSEIHTLPHGEQGGDMQSVSFDSCRECFLAYVVPALTALGFKAREEDHDL